MFADPTQFPHQPVSFTQAAQGATPPISPQGFADPQAIAKLRALLASTSNKQDGGSGPFNPDGGSGPFNPSGRGGVSDDRRKRRMLWREQRRARRQSKLSRPDQPTSISGFGKAGGAPISTYATQPSGFPGGGMLRGRLFNR